MNPSLWNLTTIGDVAQLGSGSTPSRAKQSEYYDGGIVPWVKTGDLNNGLILKTDECITQKALDESSCRVYPAGTLLVAMYGGFKQIGRTGLLGRDAAINQALTSIDLDLTVARANYVQHWLNFKVGHWKRLAGSSRKDPNITKSEVAVFPLLLPPLSEQAAISNVLSNWDRGIRQLTDLISVKLRFKQGLMQQLLTGGLRFPEFGDECLPTPIGDLLLESRVAGSDGATAKKITIKLYGKGVIAKSDLRLGSASTKYYRRSRGQFIYSKLDFLNGAFGIVPDELDGFESTLDLPAFDFTGEVDPAWFLYFVVREQFYTDHLGLANGGRKARRVNPIDLLKIEIPLPSLAEQKKIAKLLNAMDREIELLRKQLELLKLQKKGLMQKLLTGQVRVKLPKGAK